MKDDTYMKINDARRLCKELHFNISRFQTYISEFPVAEKDKDELTDLTHELQIKLAKLPLTLPAE